MSLSVTPNPLVKGGQAEVTITGGPPNTTVTVDIDNGGDLTDTLEIELDAAGNGSASWTVPASNWLQAKFNYDDQEVVRPIVNPIT